MLAVAFKKRLTPSVALTDFIFQAFSILQFLLATKHEVTKKKNNLM